ncbi:surfeit locus 1 family protein [Brevundimonas alba]|uniref:SURF1-like protein n=1 Tax=Brevundimonas alba TaxID=74314 RepID=A0A7X6BLS8_9CAUL|nr:SURF1 family protein [Brevundimonas alba]NJC40268.1 surfeit locus 1 family protein [Brevundimonas alba]
MRRFPWVLTAASAVLFVLLSALGVWQVQRLQWKQGLIAEAEAAAARPAAPLRDVIRTGDTEFRRVLVDCPGLSTAPFVELQTIQDGQAGVRLISACPVDRGVYLVDRGFVADVISARPPVAPDAAPLRIEAVIRTAPGPGPMALPPEGRRFYARDNAAIAKTLGAEGRVAAETLFAVTSTNPEWLALKPSAPPAAFSNNHLGYAITWFGLALALLGVYVALLRRRLKPSHREERPS